jgi:translation initiation factor IF-2
MSEERVIRINKVLREFNISLERAVDYLKDKGIAIDANPNAKISDAEFNILENQFAGDKGKKEASLEVSEEKRKEKEALRLEREKEIEDKRKLDEERQKQNEVIKAKATVVGLKKVGSIDLNPKKSVPAAPPVEKPAAKQPEVVAPVAIV